MLSNYADRHRAGLRVGTAITEGAANFLVNHRMNKSQQMRWSRRGAAAGEGNLGTLTIPVDLGGFDPQRQTFAGPYARRRRH